MLRRRGTPAAPEVGCSSQDRTPGSVQMAKSQKTVPAFPQTEGVQAAAAVPILLSDLRHSGFDHLLHQGICRPTRRLCSPTSAPTPKLSKKPKMQATGDTFPTDWSPPHFKFLTPRALQAGRRVGTVGPRGLRRLACWVPMELEQKPQASDPKEDLASLEELFRSAAGPSRQAAAPAGSPSTMFTSEGSESYVNSLDYLLQEKREQALEQELEQEPEKLPVQDCPDLDSLDLDEKDMPLTPEHRKLVERFSMSLQVIPSVHPGETIFLPRHQPLPCILDCSYLKPRNHLEGLFLSSPLAQQLSFLRSGLLGNLYLHTLACPLPLLQWLFQLLTWPPETSSAAFGLLWDLSMDGLFRQSGEDAHMWCPQLPEIREALHSLGAHSPAWCPQAPAEHSGRVPKREASLSCGEQQDTPQETALDISLSYICKFLTLCALAQPGATTDGNLLDLMELMCRAGLDVGLRLLPKTDLQQLLLQLLENIRQWPGKLQQLCSALSLASDHHHLSLVVIARVLNQQETLPLWQEKAQDLRPMTCPGQSHFQTAFLWAQPSACCFHDGPSQGLLPVSQPPDTCWRGGQLPRHYSRPVGGAAAAVYAAGPPHQHPYPGEPRGHAPDQTQGPGCPDLHPLAGAAVPLAAPGAVLQPLGRDLKEQSRGGPGLSALAGNEEDPWTWRKQRMETRGGPV
uniref:Family with sequence similarity 178 member B n=1 Tax=Molossus molossus TaxID=27622 RepID=A0A7J8E1I5_MOLMO|nr:family with sequence similarity 178 member B [Molossus molossus]